MGNFEDFLRYGLPGYIFIASIISVLMVLGILPFDINFYKDFLTIIGVSLIIIGPLVGFIIHQIYFVYFDFRESYTKPTRGCIALIYNFFLKSTKYKSNIDNKLILKQSFVTWKFLTTNFEKDFKIDDLFIRRLRNLRNYSHSFGSIVTSSIISVLAGLSLIIIKWQGNCLFLLIFLLTHILVFVLFYTKRRELIERIDELEVGIVILNKDIFIGYLDRLINLELENMTTLTMARK